MRARMHAHVIAHLDVSLPMLQMYVVWRLLRLLLIHPHTQPPSFAAPFSDYGLVAAMCSALGNINFEGVSATGWRGEPGAGASRG